MAYSDELIECAIFLARPDDPKNPGLPRQANLRRAVSSAYYALFHLLTMEAAANWKHDRQRYQFARRFDHGSMKKYSARTSKRLESASDPVSMKLRRVADIFIELQSARHFADYDNSITWSWIEAWQCLAIADEAMTAWAEIREQEAAQDYLFGLMGER